MNDGVRLMKADDEPPFKFIGSTGDREYLVRVYDLYTEVYLKEPRRGLKREIQVYGIDHRLKAARFIEGEILHFGSLEV